MGVVHVIGMLVFVINERAYFACVRDDIFGWVFRICWVARLGWIV